MSHYNMRANEDEWNRKCFSTLIAGKIYLYFGAFFTSQLFHSHLLERRWLWPTRCVSHIQRSLVENLLKSPRPPPPSPPPTSPTQYHGSGVKRLIQQWQLSGNPLLIKFVFSFLLTFSDSSLLSSTSSVLSYTYLCPKTSVFSFWPGEAW